MSESKLGTWAPPESPVSVEDAGAAVGVDSANATTAVGAAGDESSPHAIDPAADATATSVKNLPSHAPLPVLKTCRIEASSGGRAKHGNIAADQMRSSLLHANRGLSPSTWYPTCRPAGREGRE